MLTLKSCCSELLILSIVPTDLDLELNRLSFSKTHTRLHTQLNSCNPQLLEQTGNGTLVPLSRFGVCVSALLSPASVRGMFVVVP